MRSKPKNDFGSPFKRFTCGKSSVGLNSYIVGKKSEDIWRIKHISNDFPYVITIF